MTMRENMARAICVREGVDPDAMGYGQGAIMQKDMPYRLWEARLHVADACLDALLKPTLEMQAAGETELRTSGPHLEYADASHGEVSSDVFFAFIWAAKDGK
jgi:hypothetical protein